MTKREAAIVMAYTGIGIGDIADFHAYAEELLGRPVMTHEFGTDPGMGERLRDASRADFLALEVR